MSDGDRTSAGQSQPIAQSDSSVSAQAPAAQTSSASNATQRAVIPGNGTPPPLQSAPLAYENAAFLNSADGRLIRLVSEYLEPLARFRREQIQDTVVFFGSARFRGREEADHALELLENTGSRQPTPSHEQPATVPDIAAGKATDLQRKRAVAATLRRAGHGAGMYFFCRQSLRVTFWPAVICAWCYPLTAFFVLWQGFPTSLAVCWLPWIFLLVDKTIRDASSLATIGLSVVTFLVLTSGTR